VIWILAIIGLKGGNDMRVDKSSLHLPQVKRGQKVQIFINGRPVEAYAGETVAAVFMAEGIRTFRHTAKRAEPRGLFCGMGVCYECLVTVNGVHAVRACMTPVSDGMRVETDAELRL
jgi:sarcosine oxidase subunit alpha